jgi:hypothetical protein
LIGLSFVEDEKQAAERKRWYRQDVLGTEEVFHSIPTSQQPDTW